MRCSLSWSHRTEETFLDLSVDVEQNTSLSACLKGFFGAELLRGSNKFYCDTCCSLQEASKRYAAGSLVRSFARSFTHSLTCNLALST